MSQEQTVLVMGAGSIGCWLGGQLQAGGATVHLVGRPRVLQGLAERGLTLTDRDGGQVMLPPPQLKLHNAVPAGLNPGLVLLCVKSQATAEAAAELARVLPERTPVVSMQNGIRNASVARTAAPALTIVPGMVPFNVAEIGPGQFHRGTTGDLAVQAHPSLARWAPVFAHAGMPLQQHEDLLPVQWGKLLLNLNNAVNALSGLPLRQQLLNPDYRHCTAALIAETLVVLKKAGIQPAAMSPLAPKRMPGVLRLPTPIFRLVAARMLRIDHKARSSMADDLARGRTTEIDAIQGEVLRLASSVGVMAMINTRISELIRAWPHHRQPISGRGLRAALGL